MFGKQIKAVKHIQNMADETEAMHADIDRGIDELKSKLMSLDDYDEVLHSEEYQSALERRKNEPAVITPLERKTFAEISREADRSIKHNVGINDILTPEDREEVDRRISAHIEEFSREYDLDLWDYAIAGVCGLMAGMLDYFCIKSPVRPTSAKFDTQLDGVFNRAVQKAFNYILPPDKSHELSKIFTIDSADTSMKNRLSSFSGKLSPYNHRLKELSHDPVLGFIFGAYDIMNNTCTMIENGKIRVYDAVKPNDYDGNIFYAMGRMFGHLASDINAPSSKGNRGMGLPAPFMGLLTMLRNVNINGESIGANVEYMYLNGYDMRHFTVTSVPMALMEILLRVCWIIKRITLDNKTLWEALSQTFPGRMHKKFRVITAGAYGVLCSLNAGKVYITHDILSLNYAAWLGLIWNGFHAFKWALMDKHFLLWDTFTQKELARLDDTVSKLEELEREAELLPV